MRKTCRDCNKLDYFKKIDGFPSCAGEKVQNIDGNCKRFKTTTTDSKQEKNLQPGKCSKYVPLYEAPGEHVNRN